MEKQTILAKIKYNVIYGSWYTLSLLPFCVLYLISDGLYYVIYYLVRYRRTVVAANLLGSFPDKNAQELKKIEKRFYRFFCDYFVETVKLLSISRSQMKKRMVFHGVQEVEKALNEEQKDFGFIYLGHYGNWEWIASLPYHVSSSIHCAQIYHPLYDKEFDSLFLNMRNHFGGESIPMKQTLRRIIELKRQGRKTLVGFISDQLPKWNSIHFFVPFLHRETAVFTGAEQIGRQVNAAFFFGEITRPKRGYYECTFKRMPVSQAPSTDYELTTMFMNMLEQMICRTPELWLWTHKRWKRTKEEWLERQQAQKG